MSLISDPKQKKKVKKKKAYLKIKIEIERKVNLQRVFLGIVGFLGMCILCS